LKRAQHARAHPFTNNNIGRAEWKKKIREDQLHHAYLGRRASSGLAPAFQSANILNVCAERFGLLVPNRSVWVSTETNLRNFRLPPVRIGEVVAGRRNRPLAPRPDFQAHKSEFVAPISGWAMRISRPT